MNAHEQYKYKAFLSYSRRDEKLARWLHRSLEGYRVPKDLRGTSFGRGVVPNRLYPIFRDREELAASTSLSSSIENALHGSEYLIVLCTPDAAASHWVNRELAEFKKLGRADRIFAVLAYRKSEPDGGARWTIQECLPPAFLNGAANGGDGTSDQSLEPLAADLRPVGDGRHDGLLKLVAGLLGVGFETIRRRDERARRRRLWFWLCTVSLVCLTMAGLACLALWQRSIAIAERNKTQQALESANNAASGLIFDLASGTKDWQGIDQAFVNRILVRAQNVLLSALVASEEDNPQMDSIRRSLGVVYSELALSSNRRGMRDTALQAIDSAVEMFQLLLDHNPENKEFQSDLLIAIRRKGEILIEKGETKKAIQALESSVAKARQFAAGDEGSAQSLVEAAQSETRLGLAYQGAGDVAKARESMIAAHEHIAKAGKTDSSTHVRKLLGVSHLNIAAVELDKADTVSAAKHLEAARSQMLEIANSKEGNGDTEVIYALMNSERCLADLHARAGRNESAVDLFRSALQRGGLLVQSDPSRVDWINECALAYDSMGELFRKQKDLPRSELCFDRALAARESIANRSSGDVRAQLRLVIAHYRIMKIGKDVEKHRTIATEILKPLLNDDRTRELAKPIMAMLANIPSSEGKRDSP